jgi:hypothetical protein
MISLEYITQICEMVLALALLLRLTRLGGELVFPIFGLFLVVDLLGSGVWFLQCCTSVTIPFLDYRVFYGLHRILAQALNFATIYLLLRRILVAYPGLQRWGGYAVNITFMAALLIGVTSYSWESSKSGLLSAAKSWQELFVYCVMLGERVASSVALLWIVGMLLFLLWMPISLPKNIAVLIAGLTAWSVGLTAGFLVQSLIIHSVSREVSALLNLWTGFCFGYCAVFLSPAGQRSTIVMSPQKTPEEQRRLLEGLEQLNAALLRGANRGV